MMLMTEVNHGPKSRHILTKARADEGAAVKTDRAKEEEDAASMLIYLVQIWLPIILCLPCLVLTPFSSLVRPNESR